MTTRTEKLTDVDPDDLEEIVKEFEADKGKVSAVRQPNGLWTVLAIITEVKP